MSDGVLTNTRQRLPAPPGTMVSTGVITDTGDAGLDESEAAYVLLKDAARPGARVPLARGGKTFGRVSVGTSPTLLLAANAARTSALIVNNGASIVYLGADDAVSTSTGLPLAPGQPAGDTSSSDAWWAVSAAGGVDVRTVEVS